MRPTGLEKVVFDVAFKGGLIEKVAPEMSPPEGMYELENVELDEIGAFSRRRGFALMPTAAIDGTFDSTGVKKIAGRGDELFAISESSSYLGSGGGSGNSGAIVYSYSPESERWKSQSKVPMCTIERELSVVNGQPQPIAEYGCGFGYRAGGATPRNRYLVLGYAQGDWAQQAPGVHGLIYDTDSKTTIWADTLLESVLAPVRLKVISLGRYVVLLWRVIGGLASATASLNAVVFDSQNPQHGFSSVATVYSSSARGQRGWTVGTDGTSLFVLSIAGSGGGGVTDREAFIEKFTVSGPTTLNGAPTITSTATRSLSTAARDCLPGLSYAGGFMHCSFINRTSQYAIYYRVESAALGLTGLVADVVVDGVGGLDSQTCVNAAISANDCCVVWRTGAQIVKWRWVNAGSASTRANTHTQGGAEIQGAPFALNNRIYLSITGTGASASDATDPLDALASNFGHVLVELPSDTTQEDSATGNPYALALPVAAWARDLSLNMGVHTIPTPGIDGDFYIASVRESRTADAVFSDSPNAANLSFSVAIPTVHASKIWAIEAMHIRFSDTKRWQHAELDGQTVLACALPYVYNGDRAFECGFVWRPSISLGLTGSGSSWVEGDELAYKLVYEFEDFSGRRWFSDTSYPATVKFAAGDVGKNVQITGRPPFLTAMPDGAHSFSGRVKMVLYRSEAADPEGWVRVTDRTWMIFDAAGYMTTYPAFSDAGATDLTSTERCYIFGGELDNYAPPSCRSLVQHRDRLVAINLEDNSLWYTKKFRRGRGIEWSRFQARPLPQRGMGVVSMEGSLITFTNRSILVLEGEGPSATGVPADAFSTFSVLTQDMGCSEVNACWKTPRGVVFRTEQGLWMVTPQLGIVYVGAPVEDFVRTVTRFVDAAIDEELGCLRMLALVGSGYWNLVYWYDSDRWSLDSYQTSSAGTQTSSLFFRGDYYMSSSVGVRKRTAGTYRDGTEASTTTSYRAKLKTAKLNFGSLSQFKRLWRVVPQLSLLAPADTPTCKINLNVRVDTGYQSSFISQQTQTTPFDRVTNLGGDSGPVRVHLAYQKGSFYEITLEENVIGAAVSPTGGVPGYRFLGLGFELGMKRGAAKLAAGRTA